MAKKKNKKRLDRETQVKIAKYTAIRHLKKGQKRDKLVAIIDI